MRKNTIVYKILLTIIIIIFTGTFYAKKDQINQMISLNKSKQYSILYDAFQKTEAQIIMREISFMSQSIEKTKEIDEVISKNRRICTRAALITGMKQDDNFRIEEKNTDDIYEIEYHIKKNQYISSFIRTITYAEKDGRISSHFYIALNSDLNNESRFSLNQMAIAIKDYLTDIGLKPKINESIIGCFEGKPATKELNKQFSELFKYMKAKKNNVIKESNYVSITAYSPMITRYVEINGKRTNVNIALRYNSYEHKTYIWLSSPVINKEY